MAGEVKSVSWDFGDGTTSGENNPVHAFTTTGTYTVAVTVTYVNNTTESKARGSKNGNNLLTEFITKSGGVDFTMPLLLGYTGLSDALLQKSFAATNGSSEERSAITLPVSRADWSR